MELLAKVKDVFTISERGVVVAIEFISQTGEVRVGDRARLQNSDGTTIDTHVRAVEFLCNPGSHYHPRTPCQTGLMLGAEIYIFPEELTPSRNEQTPVSASQIGLGKSPYFPYNYSLSKEELAPPEWVCRE